MTLLRELERVHNQMLGFDRTFDRMANLIAKEDVKYPPHNVLKKDDDNYTIELAVAGFKQEELSIDHAKNVVTVRGEKTNEEPNRVYVHKGIGYRSFVREFVVSDYMVVKGASFVDGILSIDLENVVPEERKPKSIPILGRQAAQLTDSAKELLMEARN